MTGATGFVGAHTALVLLKAGHQLRLLVRNKEAATHYFSEHGFELNDFVVCDMSDKAKVKEAMRGCDAVFHAAAMVSLDPRLAKEVYQNNIQSIDAVIGSAIELGIQNILYVSSLGALFNYQMYQTGIAEIDESTPLGNPTEAYTRSKRDCEAHVRNMQKQGARIQITYPSGVFGPDDPKLNESNHALITFVSQMCPVTSSGIQCVDVRDLALIHHYLLENLPNSETLNSEENHRYIVAGHFYAWADLHALLESITGRTIFSPKIHPKVFRLMGVIMDWIKRIYPFDIPISAEAMRIVTQWTPANSNKITKLSGVQFRKGTETFSDTLAWLVQANHLLAKYAGKVLEKS